MFKIKGLWKKKCMWYNFMLKELKVWLKNKIIESN